MPKEPATAPPTKLDPPANDSQVVFGHADPEAVVKTYSWLSERRPVPPALQQRLSALGYQPVEAPAPEAPADWLLYCWLSAPHVIFLDDNPTEKLGLDCLMLLEFAAGPLLFWVETPRQFPALQLQKPYVVATPELSVAQLRNRIQLAVSHHLLHAAVYDQTARLWDLMPFLVMARDRQGRILFANQPLCNSLGYPRNGLLGRYYAELFPHEANTVLQEDARLFETGEASSGQLVERISDGQEINFLKTLVPIVRGGYPIGALEVLRDVTAVLRTERELAEYRGQLERMVIKRTNQLTTANRELKESIASKDQTQAELAQAHAELTRANKLLSTSVDKRSRELAETNHALQDEILMRKKIEEALRQSEDLYRSTVSVMEEGILMLDTEGNVISGNLSAARLLGFNQHQLADLNIEAIRANAIREDGTAYTTRNFPLNWPYSRRSAVSAEIIGYARTESDRRWFRLNAQPVFRSRTEKPTLVVATLSDVTMRFQAEEALRRSHEMLAAVFQHSTDALIILQAEDLVVKSSNARAMELFGRPHQFNGYPIGQHLVGLTDVLGNAFTWPQLIEPTTYIGELQFRLSDGSSFWGAIALNRMMVSHQELRFLRITDISDKLKAEAERVRLEAAVNYARDAVLLTRQDAGTGELHIEYANIAFQHLLGFEQAAEQQTSVRAFATRNPDEDSYLMRRIAGSLKTQRSLQLEAPCYRKDGSSLIADWSLSPIRDINGQVTDWILILRDVTQRKRLENEMRQEQVKRQNDINKAMIYAQEQERGRIAEDLHDELGHNLSVLKMNLSVLQSKANELDPSIQKVLENSAELLDQTTMEVRNISRNLTPNLLFDFGLVAAIRNLVKRVIEGKGLQVEFITLNTDDQELAQTIEISVYRIVQELLNNTLKYAEAEEVNIQLTLQDDNLVLMYEDDGKGFDVAAVRAQNKGLGLKNMEARARLIAASLNIDSQPGHGSTFILEVPLVPQSPNAPEDNLPVPQLEGRA